MDVVKISEAGLKRIVCMARDLAAFQALDIEDKKNLVKAAAVNCSFSEELWRLIPARIRGTTIFQRVSRGWK
ncbi:hypothetical protein GCK32_020343 [Trichostrongylus colubriformis]|uniref:Uncharacterized protein n=1 Tax=Trichostrongylus colubriformis TaxID=6319 RepID=A0AAN8J1B0_TRICO